MSGIGSWVTVQAVMKLRDQTKTDNAISARVRNCVDTLAEQEIEQAAKRMLLGFLPGII